MTTFAVDLSLESTEVKPTQPICVHWWMVDNQSVGRCKKCFAVKDFEKLRKELGKHNYRGNKKISVAISEVITEDRIAD